MTISVCVFAFVGFLSPGLHWTGAETEVYRPLVNAEVAVNQNGLLFIVQRDEASVLRLDAAGKTPMTFGRRGEGPGEFKMPTWIHVDTHHIYVEDIASRSVSAFTFDGRFVARHKLPAADLTLAKVKNGWVYGDWDSSHDQSKDVKLVLVDETFNNPKTLLTWPRLENTANVQARTDGRTKPKLPINPASSNSHLAAHPAGDKVFLVKQDSKDVLVIDVHRGKVVVEKSTEKNAIPFNTRWGDTYMKSFIEGQSDTMQALVDIVPNYPDTFPVVRRMRCLSSGHLLIEYWTRKPDKEISIEVFDEHLNKVDLGLSSAVLARLVHIDGDKIWLTHYNNDEENGSVVCVAKQGGDAFVAGHPILYEGLSGEDIIVERR